LVKRITKVTTKKGDNGLTSMADGYRVSKASPLINAIGEVDELNSWLGFLSSLEELENEKGLFLNIQNCLFDIGGILTTKSMVPLKSLHLEALEHRTKEINKELPELDNFVLPGGSKQSSVAQISRTVCRRAERSLVAANDSEPIEKSCIIYINRLSDFLFVLARKLNLDSDKEEVLWTQN